MAQAYRCRPSDLFGIDEQPAGFFFDRAVYRFGSHLENELAAVDGSKKSARSKEMRKRMILARYLGEEKFASPGR